MRVLIIYSTKNLGGAEIYALSLLQALREDVTYLVASPQASFLGTKSRNLNVDTIEVPISYPEFDVAPLVSALYSILTKVRDFQIDLIHAHHLPAAVVGSLVGYHLGIPLLLNIDSTPVRESYRQFIHSVPCYLLGSSQDVYNALLTCKVREQQVFWARPGIDLAKFPVVDVGTRERARLSFDLGVNKTIVGIAARLVEDKGVQQVIEAVGIISKEVGYEIQLLIAGRGPLEQKLKHFAKETAVWEKVHFLGEIDPEDMPVFYACLDVFVLASKREGTPLSVMEAVASGIPVVATDVGDISYIVTSGLNGYLVAGVNGAEIAQGIRYILTTVDFRSRTLQHNLGLRDQFDHVIRAKEVLMIYKHILASRHQTNTFESRCWGH